MCTDLYPNMFGMRDFLLHLKGMHTMYIYNLGSGSYGSID